MIKSPTGDLVKATAHMIRLDRKLTEKFGLKAESQSRVVIHGEEQSKDIRHFLDQLALILNPDPEADGSL